MRPFFVFLIPLLLPLNLMAQVMCPAGREEVIDPTGGSNQRETMSPAPYPKVREADVMWMKRVKNQVDLRDRRNQVFRFPTVPADTFSNLFDLLVCAIVEKQTVTAYDTGPTGKDDSFSVPLTPSQVVKLLQVDRPPGLGEETGKTDNTVPTWVSGKDVYLYEFKEIWYFDSRESQMYQRIIGICPMVEQFGKDGLYSGYQRLFWVYYPEARDLLADTFVFAKEGQESQGSFDQLFFNRAYEGKPVQESRMNGKRIDEYKSGLDALLESERLEQQVENMEFDMWNY